MVLFEGLDMEKTIGELYNIDFDIFRSVDIDFDALGTRAGNCLHRAGLFQVGQLLSMTEGELMEIHSMGKGTCREILDYVRNLKKDALGLSHDQKDEESNTLADIYNIMPEAYTGKKINFAGLSVRTSNCFIRAKILYIDQLLRLKYEDLNNLNVFGRGCMEETERYLADLGLESVVSKIGNNYIVTKTIRENSDKIFNGLFDVEEFDVDLTELDKTCLKQFEEEYNFVGKDWIDAVNYDALYVIDILKSMHDYTERVAQRQLLKEKLSVVDFKKNNKVYPYLKLYSEELSTDLYETNPDLSVEEFCLDNDLDDKMLKRMTSFAIWISYDLRQEFDAFLQKIYKHSDKYDYVISLRAEKKTLEEIGNMLGVTRERVRQIEAKLLEPFKKWETRHKFVRRLSADLDGKTIIEEIDIEEFFGKDKGKTLLYLLQKTDDKSYTFDRDTDTVIVQDDDVLSLASEYVDGLPEVFDSQKLEEILSDALEEDLPTEIIERAINLQYKVTGNYYHRSRITKEKMFEEVMKKYYPEGIHIYDDSEIEKFREHVKDEYGEVDLAKTNRPLATIISRVSILCGRGMYKAKQAKYLPKELADKIHDYIINNKRPLMMFNGIYNEFEEELSECGVDNRYYLQGILRELYGDEFFFRKDYLSKDGESHSIYNDIILYIKRSKYPVSKGQIMSEFPGLTEVMYFMVTQDEKVLNFRGASIYADNLNIYDSDIRYLSEVMDNLVPKDTSCHGRIVYEFVEKDNPDLLKRLGVMFQGSLFSVLQYLFCEEYDFERPYVARAGVEFDMPAEIIADFVESNETLEIDAVFELTASLRYLVYDKLKFLDSFNETHLFINKDEMATFGYIGVDEDMAVQIEDILAKEVNGTVPIVSLNAIYKLPQINVAWNEWLLYSILKKWGRKLEVHSSAKYFKYAEPIVSPKDCFDPNAIKEIGDVGGMVQIDDLNEIDELIADDIFDE